MNDLEELHIKAVESYIEHMSNINKEITNIKHNHLHSIHVTAHMNIEKAIDILRSFLEYKKEVSSRLINSTNNKEIETLTGMIIYCDEIIKKILGIINL